MASFPGIRSPLFYVGDKYKLMPQLAKLFPRDIKAFIDPFVGGGSTFLNTRAERYLLNDFDRHIIDLHTLFCENAGQKDRLLAEFFRIIEEFDLSCSYLGKSVSAELRRKHVKTYYAVANKASYSKMRAAFNRDQRDIRLLYLLLVYGFNHMIRFNQRGDFNLPVGNVDFNKTVFDALTNYCDFAAYAEIEFSNLDYRQFLASIPISNGDFVYCDPPYLISSSEYNKFWNDEQEIHLYETLDTLDAAGIKFGLSNMTAHKGQQNLLLEAWMQKYHVHQIRSNYISFNDNTVKQESREVYVTNYG